MSYVECRWLWSLREFLSTLQAQILVTDSITVPRERRNDLYIMKFARESGMFNEQDMKIINYCRLYLHVTTVSELFDASGKQLLPELFQCQREPWFNPSTIITLQRRPSSFQIKWKWQKLCRQLAMENGTIAISIDLGDWIQSGQNLRRWRQTYIEAHSSLVYHWKQGNYWQFRPSTHQPNVYIPFGPTVWTPDSMCHPVVATETANGTLNVHVPKCHKIKPSVTTIPTTFLQYMSSLPQWEQTLLSGVHFALQPYEIMSHLDKSQSTQILMVSDGSVHGRNVTFGWVCGTEDNVIFATHDGQGYGEPTSHRAEAWGMMSGALFLHHIYRYTQGFRPANSVHRPLIFVSDNNGLVTRMRQRCEYSRPYPNSTLRPDWDIIEQIYETIKLLPNTSVRVDWVQGHQDPEDPEITVAAKYNIMADQLARTATYSPRLDSHLRLLPAAQCCFVLNNQIITGHYTKAIRHAFVLPSYYDYLQQRYGWTSHIRKSIDWNLFQRASTNSWLPHTQLLKLVYDKLPTNSELAKVNCHQSPKCHYCDHRETFSHLLQCKNPVSESFRTDLLQKTSEYLTQKQVPPKIHQTIVDCLQAILQPDTSSGETQPQPISSWINGQLSLGDQSFLRGFWSMAWRRHLHQETSRYAVEILSADDLFTGLIRIFWHEQLRFWGHHTQQINKPDASTKFTTHDKLHSYKARIRYLHSQRVHCLHGHQDQYFHEDLEQFLTDATANQMRQYLHHYEPAILHSIKIAKDQPRRTIFTFPGFLRQKARAETQTGRLLPPVPNLHILQHSPQQIPNGSRGAPPNRKHSRWKQVIQQVQSIRQYFTPT